ncbi:MAG: hypothetical protein J6U14_02270 [Bacteroidaceae bacterium]|nr:hypothetical protein [Bacteroidaceae bacterium]
MIPQYRIFYSWQSDNKEAKKTLRKALDAVAKQLKGDNIALEIVEGGGGKGFISIEDAVRMKIQKCDIFVGDVTPIGNVSLKSKLLPNANVMYEMGIATESMTSDRIIAVAMAGEWKVEDMPFDFNHYSMLRYAGADDLKTLTSKIKERIKETDKIERRVNKRFFSRRLLNRNILSKKYLPDTFLENRVAKEKARIFCAPYKMYGYLTERLSSMSFEMYNAKRRQYGKTEDFKLDLSKFEILGKTIDLDKLYELSDDLLNYLRPNVNEMDKDGNHGWSNSLKVRRIAEKVDLLNKKFMVVTSEAGQGKTNFVCDLVNNLFQAEGIPYIFVNAYELSAKHLARSVAQEYNFLGNGSLEDAVLKAERFCQQNLQYLIIVIDGLNENVNQRLFRNNLTRVLSSIGDNRHVKVVMTCRKTFWDQNYSSLREVMGEDLVEVSLDRRYRNDDTLEKNEKDCIIERYAAHFKTKGTLHPAVADELTSNLLLLRIYFETNSGLDVSKQDFIDRIDLYERYYDQLCQDIQRVLEHHSTTANVENVAYGTFQNIVKWMINEDCFRNLNYDKVVKSLSDNEHLCFENFLNANLILRHDPTGMSGGAGDVINFTFEEIRDFLSVKYLIEEVYPADKDRFWILVDTFTDEINNLAEGFRRFLFLYVKNKDRKDIEMDLKKRLWFIGTFNEYVWDVIEERLTDDDIALVKKLIVENSRDTIRLLSFYHWSPKRHAKLNLNTLFETLESMGGEEQEDALEKAWRYKNGRLDLWGGPAITERSEMVRAIEAGIKRRASDEDSTERDVLTKMLKLLIDTSHHKVYVTSLGNDSVKEPLVIRGYDYYRYLMTVHKGTKKDFLRRAGTTKGFAKKMFGQIYDAIFEEAKDVEEMFKRYYKQEYRDISHFISMYYCIPLAEVKHYTDAIATGDYRVIDFSSLDYGSSSFENLFTSDEMFERMYNWLNWKEDEDKN